MARRFRQAPGGKTMHHDYIGGLLEHTVSVVGICRFLSSHYEGVNGDLLTAGALLHDVGKVHELSYEGAFDYTDEGRLLGHLYMGAEYVDRVCASLPGFPPEKAMLLKHMILSHHGELEYGSPKRPKILEAVLLHFVENMDAKVTAFNDAIEDLPEGVRWTDYQRMFERYLFSGKFLPGKGGVLMEAWKEFLEERERLQLLRRLSPSEERRPGVAVAGGRSTSISPRTTTSGFRPTRRWSPRPGKPSTGTAWGRGRPA